MIIELNYNFVVTSLLVSFFTLTYSQEVKVFLEADFQGRSATLNVSQCFSPLPKGFDKAISSVHTQDNCAQLYKDLDCQGEYIVLRPYQRTPSHQKLSDYVGYDNAASSIGPCHDDCHPDNIEKPLNRATKVTLYQYPDFKGSRLTLDVQLCTRIPPKMDGITSSIGMEEEVCIELYKNLDCTGPSIKIEKGYPWRNNLEMWGFDDRARSASLCGYNCNKTESVSLFAKTNYEGLSKILDLSKGCATVPDRWVETKSINTNGLCIRIYADTACSIKDKNIELSKPEINLESKGFDRILRSIQSCDYVSKADIANRETSINWLMFSILLGLFVLVLIFGATAIVLLRRKRKRVVVILSEKEIEEFIKGVGSSVRDSENGSTDTEFLIPTNLPYDQNYEVSKDNLIIDMRSSLGSGEYAVVYPGRLKSPNSTGERHVAVKTVKPFAGTEYVRAMLKEIKTMIYVGQHSRIVELVGCCTQNLRNAELFVLTDLCSNGSLNKFLKNHRNMFENLVEKGQIQIDPRGFNGNTGLVSLAYFNTFHLLQWSLQIAEGMEYLARKKIIHGDLATRNVLLDGKFNAKISDFGLSKQLYEYTQYVKKNQAPLPWRWLALESLSSLEFSTESDVWSFGVTIWEIFTLGDTPYPGMVWAETFILALADGLRLSKPKYATSDCYNLMLSCWRESPEDRITFIELRVQLEEFLAMKVDKPSDAVYNPLYLDLS